MADPGTCAGGSGALVKDDRLYLVHIRECIGRIQEYTALGKADFMSSTKTQDAVVRNFEIIGEAAKRVSDETRQRYPQVPWRTMAGLRDVLIHNYMSVDLERVWGFVERDLPGLAIQLDTTLSDLFPADDKSSL